MLAVKLFFLLFSVIATIYLNIYLAYKLYILLVYTGQLVCILYGKINSYISFVKKSCYNIWKKFDSDEKIIATAIPIWLFLLAFSWVFIDKTNGYQSSFSMMLQLTGITLASVAAIIAYKNYRRKSGDKLSYLYETSRISSSSFYLSSLMLCNEKDKLVSIFAVDMMIADQYRIRLIDFSHPIKPFTLSAFESKRISLNKVHLYGNKNYYFDFKNINSLICVTSNGEIKANELQIYPLSEHYLIQQKILRALRIQNTPKEYTRDIVDPNAKYWVEIFEKKLDMHSNCRDFYYDSYILTGYFIDNKFFITDESFEFIDKTNKHELKEYVLKHMHDKTVDESNYCEHDIKDHPESPYCMINGLFHEEEFDKIYRYEECYPTFQLNSVIRIKLSNGV